MKYTLFQNDEALFDTNDMEEAEALARTLIKNAKVANRIKGLHTLRPSQYVQMYKYIKEITK